MTKISILIPIYNVEKYLSQCLESVVSQSLTDIEIFCINDGSTDSSLSIIKDFLKRDSRIKLIDKTNTGYGDSMNMGLKEAHGEYIGIVESDDFIEPKMFEVLYNLAQKDNLEVARSEFFFYDNETHVDKKSDTTFVPHHKILQPVDEKSVFYQQPSIWANIYRTDFLKKHSISFLKTPGASYQDVSFTFKVYACAERFEMIDDAFYHYRTNAGSSSFQGTTNVFSVIDEYDEIKQYCKKCDLWEANRYLVAHMEHICYLWNYNRLIEPYKSQFADKWKDIASRELASGDISSGLFSRKEMTYIESIIENGTTAIDPVISVIVPVYNTEQYLEKCLSSIAIQTFGKIEIICVNDGSKDGSQKIIDRFVADDSRFVSLTKKNGGQSSARNAALKVARGEYIAFVDSDDWIEPTTYENAVKCIKDVDVVIFGVNIVGDAMMNRRQSDLIYYSTNYSGKVNLTEEVLFNTHVSAWNKLYRAEIIRNHNIDFPEGSLFEDYAFYWKYFSCCNTAFYDRTLYYNYLRHEGSIMFDTLVIKNAHTIDHLLLFDDIYGFISKNGSFKEEVYNKIFLDCFWFSYLNIPDRYKSKVLRKGHSIATRYDLKNDKVIDSLIKKDYKSVDPKKLYSLKSRLIRKMILSIAYTCKDEIHSLVSISRDSEWTRIYDQYSSDPNINLGYTNGITGTMPLDCLSKWMKMGTRLRFYASVWNVDCCTLDATIMSPERFIAGSSTYDGMTFFSVSVDCKFDMNSMTVYAVDPIHNIDYSKNCRIFRIEVCR